MKKWTGTGGSILLFRGGDEATNHKTESFRLIDYSASERYPLILGFAGNGVMYGLGFALRCTSWTG